MATFKDLIEAAVRVTQLHPSRRDSLWEEQTQRVAHAYVLLCAELQELRAAAARLSLDQEACGGSGSPYLQAIQAEELGADVKVPDYREDLCLVTDFILGKTEDK